jgi:hypothetical protein
MSIAALYYPGAGDFVDSPIAYIILGDLLNLTD